ncbi:multicopper oxidase domain-containing protein [Haloarcula sp. JP-L23]|uniref:multicopper oxidase domain-containing protein n=1 Tax=Haloarcula sp. JP-L23 TaxID=2716717 RepID=UPI00140F1122|nr:multicopper oxidase domain-containing protein [Haloarcula sp. JP-L23]
MADDGPRSTGDREDAAELTESLSDRLVSAVKDDAAVSRRAVLGGLGLAGASAVGLSGGATASGDHDGAESPHGRAGVVGEFQSADFDPHEFLRTFETGTVKMEDGQRVREFELDASLREIEIAPGVTFPAWTYNGQVPGPTLRAVEGELVRIRFSNGQDHPHTIHPHLKNVNPQMDGIPQNGPGVIEQGERFVYEWQARPAGCHFYHCHSMPLKEHIHRGLYGAMIIDPDPERVRQNPRDYVNYHGPMTDDLRAELVEEAELRNHEYRADEVDEMVMVMNGFDTNFDGDNEVYAANTRAFAYGVGSTDAENGEWEAGETVKPIQIRRDQRQRVYLINAIEFDLVNSFHTHSQFFDYYDHGTTLKPTHKTIDTIMQCQAQRGIVELDYSDHQPGLYMFHAHQSEFAELGWMSFFEVRA